MEKPLLLLDVDGVLAPFHPGEGYAYQDLGAVGTILVNPDNRRRVAILAKLFEVVWCTAREVDAPNVIGPLHGMAKAPYITFNTIRDQGAPGHIIVPANPSGGSWKLPSVEQWVIKNALDRPIAWVDDDLGLDVHEWAALREEAGTPTLLVEVDPLVGLDEPSIQQCYRFCQRLQELDSRTV